MVWTAVLNAIPTIIPRSMITPRKYSSNDVSGLKITIAEPPVASADKLCGESRLNLYAHTLLPPRQVRCPDDIYGGCGGQCVPASLHMQLKAAGKSITRASGLQAARELRLAVVSFAEQNVHTRWSETAGLETLGQVVVAASCGEYFKRGLRGSWQDEFQRWAHRHRHRPLVGCDDGFLFAAAACYGVRIHMLGGKGMIQHLRVAAPPSAARLSGGRIRRPSLDVHLGIIEQVDSEADPRAPPSSHQHCVSLAVSPYWPFAVATWASLAALGWTQLAA